MTPAAVQGSPRSPRNAAPGAGACPALLASLVLLPAAALGSGEGPGRMELKCLGPVEWRAAEGGSLMDLSGEVRLEGEGLSARSRRGRAFFKNGKLVSVLLEREVRLRAKNVEVAAGSCLVRRKETGALQAVIEPGPEGSVVAKTGGLTIRSSKITYDGASGVARFSGPITASSARLSGSAREAVLTLEEVVEKEGSGKPGGEEEKPAEEVPEKAKPPASPSFRVKQLALIGPVEIEVRPPEGGARRVRAQHALYDASSDVLVLSGEPAPEIEADGVLFTAPEIRLHLKDGRIDTGSSPIEVKKTPDEDKPKDK